jgi:DNA-binding HxlR family transcriptional regulator
MTVHAESERKTQPDRLMSRKSPPRRSPLSPQECHLARAFDVIGDRWTLLILRSALYGVRRFDDFAAELGAPRTVLADRLKRLTAAGLLARRDYREPGRRPRPEYWLTPKGAELRLPFVALTQWGDLWLADGRPPPLAMRSRATGEALRVALVDGSGREVMANEQKLTLSTRASAVEPA